MLPEVDNKMSFHYLPLTESFKGIVLEKLDIIYHEWMESWFAKTDEVQLVELDLTQTSKEKLISEVNSDFFYRYQVKINEESSNIGKSRLAIFANQSMTNFLLEKATGYNSKDLANSRINPQAFIQEMILDLAKKIGKYVDVCQQSTEKYLSELNLLPEKNKNLLGVEFKIQCGEHGLSIFIPNVCLKRLMETNKSKVDHIKLVSRESCVSDIPVKVSVKIEGFNLLLGDLKTLQPGDVLTTRQKKSEQINLQVNKKIIRAGNISLGQYNGSKAIRIDANS